MKNFAGKICFVSGGASGAGLGQAKLFAKNGMKVAIGDVRQDALDNAVKEIVAYAGCAESDVLALKVDLTNRAEYTAAADKIEETFGGPPHLLIQTAGVNSFGPVEASTFDDFDWVVGVCFHHVVNGLLIFVPRMIQAYAGKEEFHVATTSSGGGFMAGSGCGPYSAAKAAVNNLMYSYAETLPKYGGGATVLCPANINSNIGNAEKFRPEHLRNTGYHVSEGTMMHLRSVHATGQDPIELAEILKEAIETGRIIAMPDPDPTKWKDQLRGFNETIENYTLTKAERDAIQEAKMKAMMEAMKDAPPQEGPLMWAVPEGAEAFGQARKDLVWIKR